MTSRSDLPRLGAALGTLGTLLEDPSRGQAAYDRMQGWQHGPRSAPKAGERGGGGGEAAAEDRKAEEKQRQRAAEHFAEFRADLDALERLTYAVLRRVDVACPPNLSELKNRRTEDLDPMTPADAAVAGWCASCWRNDQQMVPIETNKKTGLRYHTSMCRWCGGVCSTYKVDMPPLEIVKLRHAGHRISVSQMEEAIAKATKAKQSKGKTKGKGKKGKRAA